jgi:ATP-dependent RNA helicase HelY
MLCYLKSMTKNFNYKKRRSNRIKNQNQERAAAGYGGNFTPRADRKLRKFFSEIGVPEQSDFVADDFQIEAIEKIRNADVIVSAPTGSGKTWIAVQAMKEMLSLGKRSWYASPLKALSNSKYQEFSEEFGEENVGILTGDRKENTEARIVVGTTEILRNHLYDSMNTGEDFPADLVVMDEAHYLGDIDRGVVWEEVMIYLPQRVRLLLLSATIQNDREIAQWLSVIRKSHCNVVHHEKRTVPIYPLYLFPTGEIVPLSGFDGISPKIRDFLVHSQGERFRRGAQRLPFGEILDAMDEFNLLPAIFFLKSRDDCNNAVFSCAHRQMSHKRRQQLEERISGMLDEYPFLENHPQLSWIREHGVGAHHGGQLPHWKIVVEKLMNEGYLDAIFSTSTVAAGVNFPARTVVLVQSDRFNGREFVDLTAMELHQAVGRAGRRGKDKIGFALVVHGPFQNPHLIDALLDSHPEPIKSQIKINFSMALNLLLSHSPDEIRELLAYSYATFQNMDQLKVLEDRREDMVEKLAQKMEGCRCDSHDDIIQLVQKRKEGYQLLGKMEKRRKTFVEELFKEQHLYRGKLFVDNNGKLYCALGVRTDRGEVVCECLKMKGSIKTPAGNIKTARIPLSRVTHILDGSLLLPEDLGPEEWAEIRAAIDADHYEPMPYPRTFEKEHEQEFGELIGRIKTLETELKTLPCKGCSHFPLCHEGKKNHFMKHVERVQEATAELDDARNALWKEFERHLQFVVLNGFADENGRLTEDGLWAAQLRIDQPLMIAELIRKGILNDLTPELMCGVIAPFVNDKFRDLQIDPAMSWDRAALASAFARMKAALDDLMALNKKHGFEVPLIQFWPAAAMFAWAGGMSWEDVIQLTSIDEGDLAMLVFRTADNLRQIIALEGTHPQLSDKARRAVQLILREPVVILT